MSVELKLKDTINKLKNKHSSSEWSKVIDKICDHPSMFTNLHDLVCRKIKLEPNINELFLFLTEVDRKELKVIVLDNRANVQMIRPRTVNDINMFLNNEKSFSDLGKDGFLIIPSHLMTGFETASLDLDWSFVKEIILSELNLEFGLIYLIAGKENIDYGRKINTKCYKFFFNSWLHTYSIPSKIKNLLKNNYAYEIV